MRDTTNQPRFGRRTAPRVTIAALASAIGCAHGDDAASEPRALPLSIELGDGSLALAGSYDAGRATITLAGDLVSADDATLTVGQHVIPVAAGQAVVDLPFSLQLGDTLVWLAPDLGQLELVVEDVDMQPDEVDSESVSAISTGTPAECRVDPIAARKLASWGCGYVIFLDGATPYSDIDDHLTDGYCAQLWALTTGGRWRFQKMSCGREDLQPGPHDGGLQKSDIVSMRLFRTREPASLLELVGSRTSPPDHINYMTLWGQGG